MFNLVLCQQRSNEIGLFLSLLFVHSLYMLSIALVSLRYLMSFFVSRLLVVLLFNSLKSTHCRIAIFCVHLTTFNGLDLECPEKRVSKFILNMLFCHFAEVCVLVNERRTSCVIDNFSFLIVLLVIISVISFASF